MEILHKIIIDTILSLDLTNYCMDSILVFVIFLASFIFVCLHLSTEEHPKFHLPPDPTPWPVVGNLLTMIQHKPYFRWVVSMAEGKDIARVRFDSVNLVIVNPLDLVCEFLKKHMHPSLPVYWQLPLSTRKGVSSWWL